MPRISRRKILLLAGVAIALGLIYFLPYQSRQEWETCTPQTTLLFVPTVEKFSEHYVILGGGRRLWEGGKRLRFDGFHGPPVYIWLLLASDERATFAYEFIEDYGGRAPGTQQRFETRCQYTVTPEDAYFRPRDPVLILRPDDLDHSWEIKKYIEYVYYSENYHEYLGDQLKAYFETTHYSYPAFGKTNYAVYLVVQQFDSEDRAREEFQTLRAILKLPQIYNSGLVLQLDDYTELCQENSCDFLGYRDHLFMQITVVARPRLFNSEPGALPPDKWYQLVNLGVDKFLAGIP